MTDTDARRARMRAVLAEHGRVPHDLIDQILDELETALHEGETP